MGEVDLLHVVEDVLALLENQCQKKKIEINKRLIGLPKIKGDAELLSQVFLNLFLNAIQAMPDGGELSVGSKVCNNNSVYLEVCDTGQGIPEEKLDNIFDPFFTTKEEGSGMGLAVAYRIIKEHNGEITVESQPGKGTRFFIWLPIRPELSA